MKNEPTITPEEIAEAMREYRRSTEQGKLKRKPRQPVPDEPHPVIDHLKYGPPPPPHPEPFDHGRWRVAEEPVGTDLNSPWELFFCLHCREPMWRHSPKADLCETCLYMLLTEMAESRSKQGRRIGQLPPVNPFER